MTALPPAWEGGSRDRYLMARSLSDGAISALLKLYFRHRPEASILQVGANDGETVDPLRPHLRDSALRALLIEPDPTLFARLDRLYAATDRVRTLNAAIGPAGFTGTFHLPDHGRADVPVRYLSLLGSFRWGAIADHAHEIPETESWFQAVEMQTVPLSQVIAAHFPAGGPDLICVDTEGFDAKVLESAGTLPASVDLIVYERKFLHPDEEAALIAGLTAQGFGHWNLHPNAVAYRGFAGLDAVAGLLDPLAETLGRVFGPPG